MFRSAATKIAHNSTIPALAGNKDLRPLQDLITAEKAVLISLQKLSVDFSKASEALRTWGLNEGDDLGDILSGSTTLLSHFSAALSQYASHGHLMRDQLKAIRTREEALEELKKRRRGLVRKAEDAEKKLSKMSPEHKNLGMQTETLNRLRDEIRTVDSEIMTEEAALGDFKRATTRSCMGLKFGGLLECCEKGAIVAEFGKMLIAEVPEDVTQPGLPRSMYYGQSKTEGIVADAHRCVNEVTLSTVPSAAIRERQEYTASQAAPQIPEQSLIQPIPGENYGYNPGAMSLTDTKPVPQALYPVQYTASENPSNFEAPRSPIADSRPSLGSQPLSSYHQQEYTGGSISSQPRYDLPQIMDDFGVSPRSAGVLDGSNTSAGRFATFPVKNQGYMLQDPPRQLEQEKSLSASIAEALDGQGPTSAISTGQGNQNQISPPWNARSVSGPLPSTQHYEFSPPPANNTLPSIPSASGSPFPPPPPGAAPPDLSQTWANPNVAGPGQLDHRLTLSGNNTDDALLAYMTTAEAEEDSRTDEGPSGAIGIEQSTLGVHEREDEHHRVSRHVRFGQVEDGEERKEQKNSLEQERPGNTANINESTRAADGSEISPTRESPSHKRVPPPVFQPEEDEKSLNAAAAREVAMELEAMKVGASVQGENSANQRQPAPEFHSGVSRSLPTLPPDAYSGQANTQIQREPSPLLPPSAPFTARSVSPHPYAEMNSTSPTQAGSYGNQYNPSQAYTQSSYGSSPPNAPPAQSYAQSYQSSYTEPATSDIPPAPAVMPPRFQALGQQVDSIVPPRFQGNPSHSQASPTSNQVPPRFQAGGSPKVPQSIVSVPEVQEDSSRSASTWKPSLEGGSTPYRTPPEYPRQLGSGSPFAKSNTSLNASAPGTPLSGQRTISAAAFKRPRNASTDNQGTSGEFVKKSLPSSPYPNRQDTSDRNQSMGGAGSPPFSNSTQNPDNLDDDQYDYINAYVNNSNPNSPSKIDFGNPTSSSVPPAGGRPGGGYGEGRYATDTEGQLR